MKRGARLPSRIASGAVATAALLAPALLPAAPAEAVRMIQNFSSGRVTTGAAVPCNHPGGFVHWTDPDIPWYVNMSGQGSGKTLALLSAMVSWRSVSGADHDPDYGGTTGAGFSTDGINAVSWGTGNGCSGNCLALTALVLQQPGQVIVESDITFNSAYTWNTDGSDYDTEAVMAHELGHSLGIHHTDVSSSPFPTMRAEYFGTGARGLESDDRAALQCAQNRYPFNPPDLDLQVSPYFQVPFRVGLTASWDPVPGAVQYRVTHFRQDACGSASVTTTTTGTSSSSGRHQNCGAPDDCYYKRATVEALDAGGNVLVSESDDLCEVGPAPPLDLSVTPYFQSGYRVGLTACWDSIPGADHYRVTHFRQDACGSASVTTTTASTCSSSGAHPNCGAPGSCYFKRATVEAISDAGTAFVVESGSFCEVGTP